jgi:competence protein ComEA
LINSAINDRTTGFLILFLILLILQFLKPVLNRSGPHSLPCDGPLFIQIAGDIKFPGVYASCHRVSLKDLIGRAGGLSTDTDYSEAFRAVDFISGAKLTVRSDEEGHRFFQSEMSAFYKLTLGIPISLDRESEDGLTAIPGIGPRLARAIVLERKSRGGFKSLADMISVNGIGHKLYKKIRPYLTL